jgi:hypothetical protein
MLDTANYTPRLKSLYNDTIRASMKEEFGYKNDMQIPRLDKIVLNIGAGAESVKDSKKGESGSGRSDCNRWSKSCCYNGQEINRGLPGS